uniref:Cytochrome cc3 (Fragments) n=1 Tax=Nitratidesulfovibrio vulgaris TaxID=881 RepID=Q7M0Z0_NITVL
PLPGATGEQRADLVEIGVMAKFTNLELPKVGTLPAVAIPEFVTIGVLK